MVINENVCDACSPDAEKVSQEIIVQFIEKFNNWELAKDVGFPQLKRVFTFNNFSDASKFANKVSELADKKGHHPTILLEYGKVTVRWWSHKLKGLHQTDVDMSAQTELCYQETSELDKN